MFSYVYERSYDGLWIRLFVGYMAFNSIFLIHIQYESKFENLLRKTCNDGEELDNDC